MKHHSIPLVPVYPNANNTLFDMPKTYILLISVIGTLLLTSCYKDQLLVTSTEVISAPSCDNNVVTISCEAHGGNKPYVYQVRNAVTGEIKETIESRKNEVLVSIQTDLADSDFILEVIDDEFISEESHFVVKYGETSSVHGTLNMIEGGEDFVMPGMEINVHKVSHKTELFETVYTDEESSFNLEALPSGMYYLSISIPEKYHDYNMSVDSNTGGILVKTNSYITEVFTLECNRTLEASINFTK